LNVVIFFTLFRLGIKTTKTLAFLSNFHRKFGCNVVAMHARLHAICTLAFAVLITCDYCGREAKLPFQTLSRLPVLELATYGTSCHI